MSDTKEWIDASYRAYSGTAEDIMRGISNNVEVDGQDAQEVLAEWPLEIVKSTIMTVVLTTGGPHVEVICEVSRDAGMWIVDSAKYVAQFGSDRTVVTLDQEDAMWQAAELLISYYDE